MIYTKSVSQGFMEGDILMFIKINSNQLKTL